MSPEGSSSGQDPLFSRRSLPGMLHPWARAGSRRFPGDPSQAFALLQDPGRADTTSPLAVVPTPPPAKPNRRPQRVHNLEANTGLQLPLSTLHERRHRLPCKTRFRLAGCASTGRVSNPLGRFERFQVTSILLSRTSPVARFVYLAKAVVLFPGGYGTLDELFEILTLVQTRKTRKHMPIVLFGAEYWGEVIKFDALVKYGTISPSDLQLFHRTDALDEAYEIITKGLTKNAFRSPGPAL